MLLGAPGLTTRSKKLLGTGASLLVTSALLLVTRTLLGTLFVQENLCATSKGATSFTSGGPCRSFRQHDGWIAKACYAQ